MGSYKPTPSEWTVESALSALAYKPPKSPTSPIPFFHLLGLLKTTKREGWQQVGIASGESIADHMYRMSIMTMLCPPSLASKLNLSHCVQMSLVHDMAECLVGDITPLNKDITKAEKSRRELLTMEYIGNSLIGGAPGGASAQEKLMGLFREYEDNITLEAQFVHDVDKVEMILQVVEYERSQKRDLSEFYHVVGAIRLPEMQEWATVVLKEREALGISSKN
ncbi:hypothetical protein N7447_006012 [Penicillium robsamsonii]|uniref:uncharacterized protein n=1 Tax=Penicillium robsamsonii TaxID=1792511 RepID=UPI0025470263|nr:uncharacterized protein N7447_006012 [Penicillium robsamsonii]KAJ5823672.1 hypothetical protein N7447_006012 [Penicillium robsamsonii]